MLTEPVFPDRVNYVEIFVVNSQEKLPTSTYKLNLSQEKFDRILRNVRKKHPRCFKRSNVKTFNSTLEHTSEDASEYVHELEIADCLPFSRNKLDLLRVNYVKMNKSPFSFPSNEKIYDICHNQRLTFKLSNSVYLNFLVTENYAGERSRQIFFNINLAKSRDEGSSCRVINEAIMSF